MVAYQLNGQTINEKYDCWILEDKMSIELKICLPLDEFSDQLYVPNRNGKEKIENMTNYYIYEGSRWEKDCFILPVKGLTHTEIIYLILEVTKLRENQINITYHK